MSYDASYQRIPPIHPQPPPPYTPSYVPGEAKPTAPQFGDFGAPYVPSSQQGFLGPQQGYSTQALYPTQGPVPQTMYPNPQGYAAPQMYPSQGPYPTGPAGYYNAPAGYGQPAGWYGQGQAPGTTTYVVQEERRDQNRMADCCLVACCTLLFCELCHLFSN